MPAAGDEFDSAVVAAFIDHIGRIQGYSPEFVAEKLRDRSSLYMIYLRYYAAGAAHGITLGEPSFRPVRRAADEMADMDEYNKFRAGFCRNCGARLT